MVVGRPPFLLPLLLLCAPLEEPHRGYASHIQMFSQPLRYQQCSRGPPPVMNTTLLSPPTGILARGRHAPSLGCIATQAACAIIAPVASCVSSSLFLFCLSWRPQRHSRHSTSSSSFYLIVYLILVILAACSVPQFFPTRQVGVVGFLRQTLRPHAHPAYRGRQTPSCPSDPLDSRLIPPRAPTNTTEYNMTEQNMTNATEHNMT